MLVILPGVMDVSLAQTSGLWCSKVNTAILRKYVFELSQIRFFFFYNTGSPDQSPTTTMEHPLAGCFTFDILND